MASSDASAIWLPFAGTDVWAFVEAGDRTVLSPVSEALLSAARADANLADNLRSDAPAFHLVGLVKAAAWIGSGRDFEATLAICVPLISGLLENPQRVTLPPGYADTLLFSLFSAISRAAHIRGEPAVSVAVADWARTWKDGPQQEFEVGAVRALVQTFRMTEAVERYRQIEPTPELEQLVRGWRPDPSDRYRPRSLAKLDEATRLDRIAYDAAARWVAEQGAVHREYLASIEAAGTEQEHAEEIAGHLAEAGDALATVERDVVAGPLRGASEIFHTQVFRFQEAVRGYLGLLGQGSGDAFDAQHVVNRAALLLATASRTSDALEAVESELRLAIRSQERRSNRAGAAMAYWALALVQLELASDDAAAETRALAALTQVLDAIEDPSDQVWGASGRAFGAGQFPNLADRLVPLAMRHGEILTAYRASEAYRGLAASNGTSLAPFPQIERRTRDWHYLSVSVERESVVAFLHTASGEVRGQSVALDVDELDALVTRANPRGWHESRLREAGSPRARLSLLLAPLEAALGDGSVVEGDHVVVALDYPAHVVPIHYLDLAGRMAVEWFSFSRAGSFADAVALAGRQKAPLRDAVAFIVPDADNDAEMHRAACEAAILPLRADSAAVSVLEGGRRTDAEAVVAALRTASLVHLQAHGYFPPAAPRQTVDSFAKSGLLLARNGDLPDRSHPERFLLSPSDILSSGRLDAEHVSLSACVSGLGRPGLAGDLLGLEFALRLGGCRSVTASHWNVDLDLASRFHGSFYEHWIAGGQSRAQAWRSSVLGLLRENGSEAGRADACAFSLFGSWT